MLFCILLNPTLPQNGLQGNVFATTLLFGMSVWHLMALHRNLLCFLSDVNPSCSPCAVNSDVKCQLLSCHCEALQDSLVDSGVTCSGSGRRDMVFGGTALFWIG